MDYKNSDGSWKEDAYEQAMKQGCLDDVKYLHENGCPWDEDAYKYAALGGHLECLKYLDEIGYPWNEYACAFAVRGGHLECLKYLLEHNCPMDADTYKLCVKKFKKKIWFQVYMYVKK